MDALSTVGLHLASVQQSASTSILRKAMDSGTASSATLLSDFRSANPTPPPSAHRLDTRA